jgi:hypothetical protein
VAGQPDIGARRVAMRSGGGGVVGRETKDDIWGQGWVGAHDGVTVVTGDGGGGCGRMQREGREAGWRDRTRVR